MSKLEKNTDVPHSMLKGARIVDVDSYRSGIETLYLRLENGQKVEIEAYSYGLMDYEAGMKVIVR